MLKALLILILWSGIDTDPPQEPDCRIHAWILAPPPGESCGLFLRDTMITVPCDRDTIMYYDSLFYSKTPIYDHR